MFEAKDEIRETTNKLLALREKYKRGQVIPWNVIEAIAGSRFDGGKYVIKKWREEMLRDYDQALRMVPGIGVELLTASEQVRWCPRYRRRKMFRQSTRAMKELKHVDDSKLSDHDRKMRQLQISQLKGERRVLRENSNILRKSETNPRRKVAV